MRSLWLIMAVLALSPSAALAANAGGAAVAEDPTSITQGLAAEDPAARSQAYHAAIRLGPPMIAPLLDLLKQGAAPQSHAAQMALERIVANASATTGGKQLAAARRALVARLMEPGANAAPDRVYAARLLGLVARADPPTVAALRRALLEGGPVAEAALEAMQRLPGRALTEALIRALGEVGISSQPAVVLALGARRDGAAFAILADLARSRTGRLRLAAVQALGVLGSAKAVPVLRQVGAVASRRVRRAAVEALLSLADAPELDERARRAAAQAAQELAAR